LIDELGERKQLTEWVVELALQNLENDRRWDMRSSLYLFPDFATPTPPPTRLIVCVHLTHQSKSDHFLHHYILLHFQR